MIKGDDIVGRKKCLDDFRCLLSTALRRPKEQLSFHDVEDLEADGIADALGIVQRLRELRKKLKNDSDADAASLELQEFLGDRIAKSSDAGEQPSNDSDRPDDFQSLLEGDPGQRPTKGFVDKLLQGESVGGVTDHSDLVQQCDELINGLVAQVLANSEFRRLERSFRGLYWLASELDLDGEFHLWLLSADLGQDAAPETVSELSHQMEKISAGADGGTLAAIAVERNFESSDDLTLLSSLMQMAQRLDTTLLCKAPAGLTRENSTLEVDAGYPRNSADLTTAWQQLREVPAASFCAAVLPRILLRQPYGSRGETTYLAGFQELETGPEHDQFLWINPVYALVYLIGSDDEGMDVPGLPMPVYNDGTGDAVMPCAEAYLSEADVTDLHEKGIMALQSYRNRDVVTLSGFFAID